VTLAIFTALIFTNSNLGTFKLATSVVAPAIMMGILGLIDDLKGLPVLSRLIIQTTSAFLVATSLILTDTKGVPFNNALINITLSMLWIVGICNSINFFDNIDGGAAGTVAIAASSIGYIAHLQGQEYISALAIVTAGSTVGFLFWNKSPAKIYMGDAGALFLGIMLAVLTIRLDPGLTPIWISLSIPITILAVPILDTCVSVFSRIKRGKSPLNGGLDHLSHRLVRYGFKRKSAVVFLWCISGVFNASAISTYLWAHKLGSTLITVSFVFWVILFIWFWKIPSED
jgi:UDP-GlcNAc:undecaprenyl-phosphate GlcNAc-1-phosphate transferase